MDDFCVFSDDKQYLKDIREKATEFLKDTLRLDIKEQATLLNNKLHGQPFLGVRIFPNMIRYKRENFNRSLKKLKTREWEYNNGYIEYEKYSSSMQSITAHLTHYGNSLLKSRLYTGTVSKAGLTA